MMNYHCPRPPKQRAFDTSLLMWRRRFFGGSFSPASLFASGEDGGWYDPSDLTTLFQEITGASATTPAGVGDPVGTVLDKSGNGNHLVAPALIRRPLLQTEGGRYYLDFDGVDDCYQTPAIDFSGTDRIVYAAAIDKLSTEWSGIQMLFELGNGISTDGDTYLAAPRITATTNYGRLSRGTNTSDNVASLGAAANRRDVLVTQTDISEDLNSIIINGGTPVTLATDQGTGNYTNDIVNVGSRNAASLYFNGRVYGLLIRDDLLTDAERENLEIFLANKSGAVLA